MPNEDFLHPCSGFLDWWRLSLGLFAEVGSTWSWGHEGGQKETFLFIFPKCLFKSWSNVLHLIHSDIFCCCKHAHLQYLATQRQSLPKPWNIQPLSLKKCQTSAVISEFLNPLNILCSVVLTTFSNFYYLLNVRIIVSTCISMFRFMRLILNLTCSSSSSSWFSVLKIQESTISFLFFSRLVVVLVHYFQDHYFMLMRV